MTDVLTRRKKFGHRHTERRGLREDRARDWSDVSINQETSRTLATTRSQNKQGKISPLETSRRAWACPHLNFRFLASITLRE